MVWYRTLTIKKRKKLNVSLMFRGFWPSVNVTGLRESWSLCMHSVLNLKWLEVDQIFAVVDCLGELTAKVPWKYGKHGSFVHLLFLFACLFVYSLCLIFVFVCGFSLSMRVTYRFVLPACVYFIVFYCVVYIVKKYTTSSICVLE